MIKKPKNPKLDDNEGEWIKKKAKTQKLSQEKTTKNRA